MNLLVLLGNQLFSPEIIKKNLKKEKIDLSQIQFFMREDQGLCTYYKFHKQKIIFFLSAMRTYADELKSLSSSNLHYEQLDQQKSKTYEEALTVYIKNNKIKKLYFFEIEDKFFEARMLKLAQSLKIEISFWPSEMFISSREEFKDYLKKSKKPFMKVFYEAQRKKHKILVNKDLEPLGGQWSFDTENRKALPKSVLPPPLMVIKKSKHVESVTELTEKMFSTHPGSSQLDWIPVDRKSAQKWFDHFLTEKLIQFGPYEDALPLSSDFVFHSVLTPFMNTGLLTPLEIVQKTLAFAEKNKTPMASVEGFIRQIIGWREFIRGVYQNFSEKQESTNYWNHKNKLSKVWYTGNSGLPILDNTIKKTLRFGYSHHIERLMVVGSLMLLLEIDPKEAHKWFMEMYIDSSDWVMGPNVYGMALFSDGGIFATKPYICGSNYYRKMSGEKAGDWCDGVDGLYWSFIEKHKTFFLKNPRLSMMARTVEKMDPAKKKKIYKAAEMIKDKLTTS